MTTRVGKTGPVRGRRRPAWRAAVPAALAAALAACAVAPAGGPGAATPMERAVVRIVNTAQRGDWAAPWRSNPVAVGSGSGFVVAGGRIMTNAHVVSDSRFCAVYLHGDPAPHEARVEIIGHDCDLALLSPVEPGLLDAVPPVEFGGLPALRSTVETYGYPAGGERLSSTRGVVSRIEMQPYAHSGADAHLAVQTDAAINPGNSGGPVVADGRVVGVAFQGNVHLDNVGFFIPTEVIRHFLADAADGRYDGYPDLGILEPAPMENPAARRRAGMGERETGVRIFGVRPGGSADGLLRAGDILLAVEGRLVASDGTVELEGLRLEYGVLADRVLAGGELAVRVLRGRERLDLRVPMRVDRRQARFARAYDRLPRYFVYAGLVFVPLERETLDSFGPRWRTEADRRLVHEQLYRPVEEPERLDVEPVILLRTLAHSVNADAAWQGGVLVERVNGRGVTTLDDLVRAVEDHRGPHQVFEFSAGRLNVLDRQAAERAHPEILRTYGVERDRRL